MQLFYVTAVGDGIELIRRLPPNSVDALVTDPPAGISFMNKTWDKPGVLGVSGGAAMPQTTSNRNPSCLVCKGRKRAGAATKPCICPDGPTWNDVAYRLADRAAFVAFMTTVALGWYRVLKPGAHGLVWALPRTAHWTTWALEDAGFEIRDKHLHLFGCLTDDAEVLTPTGWVRGVDIKTGDVVAQWDATSNAITLAPVAEIFRAPWSGHLVHLRNADTDQLVTPNHRVFYRKGLWQRWSAYCVEEAAAITQRSPIRLPLAGLHDGRGVGGEDYAALLGWVWTDGGFDAPGGGVGVRIYQSSVNQANVDTIDALLTRLGAHRRYSYQRTYTSRHRGPQVYDAITWFISGPLARRIRADLPGKHPTYALLWSMSLSEKRAFLAAALRGDGTQRSATGSWAFEQKDPNDREWFVTLLSLVGWRGCNYTRTMRDGGAVSVTQHGDTTLNPTQLGKTAAYVGDVWCVRVPSGAFVARRNGQIFITGNSGFPKGTNVGKAIDEKLGAAEAARWEGWNTTMKPAYEEWILIRKPLEGTVVDNVLKYGTGAMNIDGCRVGASKNVPSSGARARVGQVAKGDERARSMDEPGKNPNIGRWPAHLSLDEETATMLDAQSGDVGAAAPVRGDEPSASTANAYNKRKRVKGKFHADSGGASRFFYVAKAPKSDKTAGGLVENDHATVKNTELMRWLVRLITPPGGVVLDSFMGSGSTGAACALEGASFIGFDQNAHYVDDIATPRVTAAYKDTMTGDDAEDTTDIDMLAPTTIPPFLRWVGGKRRQALDLAARVTAALKPGGRYIEPFLGSGAVALAMPAGTPMLLGDACLPLGYLWWWLQQHPREIAEYAAGYGLTLDQDWNTQDGFNELRRLHNATPYSDESWEPSARFLWLTSASFNGVYRESSAGEYNVPWGRRMRISVPAPETLEAVAAHIAQAQIFPGWDFEDVIDQATAGDVVFADSPYDGPKGQFTSYVKTPFDADAQLRLARAAYRARERGATVILTNSDTVRIRDFYAGWTIESALERRPVAADPERRVPAYCVVISGGPLG